MIKIKHRYSMIAITLAAVIVGGFYLQYRNSAGIIDMLSISTDGRYVASADEREYVILWDLENHTKKIIHRKAHIWAAYFIPNTHDYVWQDQNKVLHIENVESGTIDTIPLNFYSYGIVMTSNHQYFMSGDIGEGLYWCEKKQCHTLKKPWSDNPHEFIADMPYILSLLPNNSEVIGSKMTGPGSIPKYAVGVKLWDIKTGQKLQEYFGNVVQTFATISPDGKYVVAGDANGGNLFVWDRVTGKQIYQAANLYGGLLDRHGSEDVNKWTDDSSKLIPVPQEFNDDNAGMGIESIKFIDNSHYLVFYMYSHYAVLFSVKSPWPIKYLDLGKSPMPAMNYFERDQSMDTSPATHTLVMAKEHHSGILVYQYNPQDQTLTKVWDGN